MGLRHSGNEKLEGNCGTAAVLLRASVHPLAVSIARDRGAVFAKASAAKRLALLGMTRWRAGGKVV